jgi:hypothetical protein
MTKRFTSGGVGRFTFETANRLLDAADRIEQSQLDPYRVPKRNKLPHIVARLTIPYNNLQFDAESPTRTLMAWDWTEVAVVQSTGPGPELLDRAIQFVPGLMQATDFPRPEIRGAAVCIDGQASSGDIVVLHPIINANNYDPQVQEVWYAFKGSNRLFSSVPLLLGSSTSIGTRRWRYTVAPQVFDNLGNNTALAEYPAGIAFNTYEAVNFGHGQALNFTSPVSSINVAPCQGMVMGTLLATQPNVIYAFEAANPITPQCS